MKAEEKARELYPDEAYKNAIEIRKAFLKGYEYANQQPEQDKVREAAESAFNQARKQTSMLGEKDVQMTDYLISPKYKTFDDYWNSKKH